MKAIIAILVLLVMLPLFLAGFSVRVLVDGLRFGYITFGDTVSDWFDRA